MQLDWMLVEFESIWNIEKGLPTSIVSKWSLSVETFDLLRRIKWVKQEWNMWQRKQPMREKRAEESCEIWSFSGSPSELSSVPHLRPSLNSPMKASQRGLKVEKSWKMGLPDISPMWPWCSASRGLPHLAEVYPIEGFFPTILPHDKTSDEPQIVLSIPPHTTRAYRWGLTRRPFVGARLHQSARHKVGLSTDSFNRSWQLIRPSGSIW